jgi:hypothetical protein
MTVRCSWTNFAKCLAVAVLLTAVLGVFLLRIPAHPLIGYSPQVQFRSHRVRIFPSYAIVNDIFQAVVLHNFQVFLVSGLIEHHVSATIWLVTRGLEPTLRC